MLPDCCPDATGVLPGCYRTAARMLPECCPDATGLLPGCYRTAARMLPDCCPDAAGLLPGCYRNMQIGMMGHKGGVLILHSIPRHAV